MTHRPNLRHTLLTARKAIKTLTLTRGFGVRDSWMPIGLAAALCLAACSEAPSPPAEEVDTAAPAPADTPTPDTVMAQWEETLGGQFRAAIALDEADFMESWDGERDRWIEALESVESPAINLERVRYEWAYGRMLYPVLHARITGTPRQTPSAAYEAWIDEIEFSRPDLLQLDEYTGFISTRAEMQGDILFDDPQIALSGRAQYLDARLSATEAFEDPAVRCFLQAGVFEYWLESYDGNGTAGQFEAYAEACPGERTDAIMERFASETEALSSVPSHVYKTVDGHELEVFVTVPDGHDVNSPRPAALFSTAVAGSLETGAGVARAASSRSAAMSSFRWNTAIGAGSAPEPVMLWKTHRTQLPGFGRMPTCWALIRAELPRQDFLRAHTCR